MNCIYNSSLNFKQKTTAQPICFIPQYNLLFYNEVPGKPLSALFQQSNKEIIKKYLILAGQWLAQLHQLPIKKFFRKAFYPGFKGYKNLFIKIKQQLPELEKYLTEIKKVEFTDKIWKAKNKLIHADFYPGNIVVKKNNLFVIDFDKSGIGPPLMDVATLYGCLEFPKNIWKLQFNQGEREEIQEVFLNSYCQAKNVSLAKTKVRLKKFLAKIFLDQLRYYFLFESQNINLMTKKNRVNLVNKLKALILKIKKYL